MPTVVSRLSSSALQEVNLDVLKVWAQSSPSSVVSQVVQLFQMIKCASDNLCHLELQELNTMNMEHKKTHFLQLLQP